MGHSKVSWNKERLSGLTLSQFEKRFSAAYPDLDLKEEFYRLFPDKKKGKQPPTEKEVLENIKARTGN